LNLNKNSDEYLSECLEDININHINIRKYKKNNSVRYERILSNSS